MRRVVVTGLGAVCPVGNSALESFDSLINGKSGIAIVERWRDHAYAEEKLKVQIGGEVKNFNAESGFIQKKDVRRTDRFIHFAMEAARQAWMQSGLPEILEDPQSLRAGVIVGVGLLGMNYFLDSYDNLLNKGPSRVSPFFIPACIPNLAPGTIAIKYNLKNANWSCSSACASGTHAIGEAFMHIKHSRADIMLAGGAESAMHPLAASGFESMHALCLSKNHDPKAASRPFDKERDGFVMGEGAGMLVLEEYEHAKKRNAPILAEVIGYGSTSDAFHITMPPPGGEGAKRAMQQAIEMGEISLDDVDYINAHGTSTIHNDKLETQAIKSVFKEHAKNLLISSTKSMTGHLLGAAGGVEAVFSVLSLKNNIIPPTINLTNPDPECDLDYVPNFAKQKKINVAMSNSFGFGGANAVLVFKKNIE